SPVPIILSNVEGDTKIIRIIIDEIGMVRVDITEQILQIIKKIREGGRHIQLVCVGDFSQIKPVVTNKDKKTIEEYGGIYAYNAPSWSEFRFKIIGLYNYFRLKGKDEITQKYKEVIYGIKYGQVDGVDWLNSNIKHKEDWSGIFICGTHEMVDHYNSKYVMDERFRDNLRLYKAKIKGTWKEKERPVKDKLFLAPGMRVMATVNASDHTYKNGYRGRITKLADDGVWVFFPRIKAEVLVTYYTFRGNHRDTYEQLPLAIAKAVTIHSIQGQTIDEVVNVVGPFFESGQLYVALTRITRVSNLRIIGMLKPEDVIADPDAVKWAT
ncbi:MAG: hypothetical protein K6A90_14865, partial [Lachnospiraceae bacterium]|nr:hypothetical protein [Lachnospiraceae bacterium]